MIERYTTESMGAIWSDQNKYQVWLDVEIAVLEVLCEDGIVPKEKETRNENTRCRENKRLISRRADRLT